MFTVFVDDLIRPDIAMTQASHRAEAQKLFDTYITTWGLDGLDIDVERTLTADQLRRASGIMTALGELIGPRSGTDYLFIYDTNMTGAHPLFQATASSIDYVFLQAYGRSVTSLQRTWETFSTRISSCQFLPGFSFYEERGARWGDVSTPFESSRAAAYARWQPTGGEKGGVFAYAIDRDGKVQGDDTITRTDFSWMTRLKQLMLDNDIR